MKKTALLLAGLVVSASGLSFAHAEEPVPAASAVQNFGRLSADGNAAFEELTLARKAIFDGDLASAKTLIAAAQQDLARARADNTAFEKAEADLMPTKVRNQPPRPLPEVGKQVAWLPIDGELVLDETLSPTTERTAALAMANTHLKSGDTTRAAALLRSAGVDADYIIAAVPLEQTRNAADKAAHALAKNPYKASEALRSVEDSVRYASVDIQGVTQQPAAP